MTYTGGNLTGENTRNGISSIAWQAILFGVPIGLLLWALGFNVLILAIVPAIVALLLVPGRVLLGIAARSGAKNRAAQCCIAVALGGLLGAFGAVVVCAFMGILPIVPALCVGTFIGVVFGAINAST